jgi:hypothetical protein
MNLYKQLQTDRDYVNEGNVSAQYVTVYCIQCIWGQCSFVVYDNNYNEFCDYVIIMQLSSSKFFILVRCITAGHRPRFEPETSRMRSRSAICIQ